LAAEQEALRARVAAAQAKAKEFQGQAQATAQQYAQRAHAAAPGMTGAPAADVVATPVAVNPAGAPDCPSCGTAIVPGDVFCASCGHRLS
jgi:zinc-ribbon domain